MIQEIHLSVVPGVYLLSGKRAAAFRWWSATGTGKPAFYVGQSEDILQRFKKHRRDVRANAGLRCVVLAEIANGSERNKSERRFIAAAWRLGLLLCNGQGSMRTCRERNRTADLDSEVAKLNEALAYLKGEQ